MIIIYMALCLVSVLNVSAAAASKNVIIKLQSPKRPGGIARGSRRQAALHTIYKYLEKKAWRG